MKRILVLLSTLTMLVGCNTSPKGNLPALDDGAISNVSITPDGLQFITGDDSQNKDYDFCGATFYLNNVGKQNNQNKIVNPSPGDVYIQISNHEREGYLFNKTPVKGTVTIEYAILKTFNDTDPNCELSVYYGDTIENTTTKVTSSLVSETTNKRTYRYGVVDGFYMDDYHYFKIVNESGYAQYLYSISW